MKNEDLLVEIANYLASKHYRVRKVTEEEYITSANKKQFSISNMQKPFDDQYVNFDELVEYSESKGFKGKLPKYNHDCDRCMFLGNHEFKNDGLVPKGYHDIYACPQGGSIPTIIIRFGNDGPDYFSGMQFIVDAIDNYKG